MFRVLYSIFQFVFFLVLPFFTLIRLSLWLNQSQNFYAFLALGISGIAVAILLFLYFTYWYGLVTGRTGRGATLVRRSFFVIVTVMGVAVHMLFFGAQKNFNTQAVQSEFTSLHPILRAGVSSLIYFDNDAMITDAERIPEDYSKMGLRVNESSLHYKQDDGYVHAIDLRTRGRSFLKNKAVEVYFKLMGFRTLRHVGTADHLHVSIKH